MSPLPLVLHGSVVPLQDMQTANQGWSFIRSNRVFVLRDYVRRLVHLQPSSRIRSVLLHVLIRSNLFQNRSCSPFPVLKFPVFFFYLLSLCLIFFFIAPLHHIHSKALNYNKMRSSAFHLLQMEKKYMVLKYHSLWCAVPVFLGAEKCVDNWLSGTFMVRCFFFSIEAD